MKRTFVFLMVLVMMLISIGGCYPWWDHGWGGGRRGGGGSHGGRH